MAHLRPGQCITPRTLTSIQGAPIEIPDPDRLVHLQFRRFAGCPICNLHVRSVARRHAEIEAAGIREVVVFHSTVDAMLEHQSALPFATVADPAKRLYLEFGVAASLWSVLDPRTWPAALRGALIHRLGDLKPPTGGRLGLPADLLIASDGRVIAAHYGAYADDQWSVDTLLHHARSAPAASHGA